MSSMSSFFICCLKCLQYLLHIPGLLYRLSTCLQWRLHILQIRFYIFYTFYFLDVIQIVYVLLRNDLNWHRNLPYLMVKAHFISNFPISQFWILIPESININYSYDPWITTSSFRFKFKLNSLTNSDEP